jgi:uncharacterized protein with HEPN domain
MGRDDAYLLDILIACQKITQFKQGVSWKKFKQNELLQLALVRILEVMGEAANNILKNFKMLILKYLGERSLV